MKSFITTLLLLVVSIESHAATREFCFRAYSTGITSLVIDDTPTEIATISDSHILQSPNSGDVQTLTGNQKVFSIITDNIMGYSVGGLHIRFEYVDSGTELDGTYELSGDGSTPFAGGPFKAYLLNSPDCIRPQAPSNLSGRPFVSTVEADPTQIQTVTLFNSGYGHTYAPDTSCRSQKHSYDINDNDTVDLRLPNTSSGTSWKVWAWIWEDNINDRSIIYQNVDNPWLFIKIHHVFSSPPALNTVIAGGQMIGTARNTVDESSFGISVEFIDSNGQLKMASIFDLYSNQVINNSYPGLIVNGQIDRSVVIRPDDYQWPNVEPSSTSINTGIPTNFANNVAHLNSAQRQLPDISPVPRTERCLGNFPARVTDIFPNALADNYVMHVSDLANHLPYAPGQIAETCNQFGLKAIDSTTPDYCIVEEHISTAVVDIR